MDTSNFRKKMLATGVLKEVGEQNDVSHRRAKFYRTQKGKEGPVL